MNEKMRSALLVGIILLLAACGQVETLPAPESTVTVAENPIETPGVGLTEAVVLEKISKYIGSTYSSLPEGLSQDFGMIIQGTDDYALSLVSEGGSKMLWLSKLINRDPGGSPNWEVKDVLDLSNLEAGLILVPDGCFLNGVPDNEIFAAGKNGALRLAWRANTTLGRFESIPTDGIRCDSDKGMGLD